MNRLRRLVCVFPALLAVLPSVGCSVLGLSPPAYKLTETAERLRAANPAPVPLPKELNKTLLAAYVVEPGDTLLVVPARLDSPIRLPGDQTVLQDGSIDLGDYGRPVVAGKTVPQVEAQVRQLVEAQTKEKEAGTVNVRLVGRVSKVFYVLGEVNAPGAYPISGRETALDGIIAAGGLTRKANSKKITLARPTPQGECRIVLPVCYDNVAQIADPATNYQLQPGDRIFVPTTGSLDGLKNFCKKNKDDCGPCNCPQVPCILGGDCSGPGGCAAGPAAAPAPFNAPPPSLGTHAPVEVMPAAPSAR